ncbi:MAG: radical SAM protein [Chloroflexota bacterium]|nr:MAG: radical SAM protein [Chloroflexota bacterium]
MAVKLIAKKGSTFHDFPYSHPERKCFHCWIINVTPAGPNQCLHNCIYCYAREAIYSNYSENTLIYNNLPELVERDLEKLTLCPPISLSNISDPCQDIPELKGEVKRLIRLLMDYGVSFFITTKGDPFFLLELPGFIEYKPKFIAITIEGTPEILGLLSPGAPTFDARVSTAGKLASMGIDIVIRLDPVLIHLFQALYGAFWFEKVAGLVDVFAEMGARHVTASTGRLSKKRSPSGSQKGTSIWQRLHKVIHCQSPSAAKKFEQEYIYEAHWSGGGYRLRKDLRLDFHHKVRELVEADGMTYATCQELSAGESDSQGIPHCEGLALPFTRKQADGRFKPVPGCTANCRVSCRGSSKPPCGQAELITSAPLRLRKLRLESMILQQ